MGFYVLSDVPDTLLGMRMAGMPGQLVKDEVSLRNTLEKLAAQPELGVIVITAGLVRLVPDVVTTWKLKRQQPLLVEIPDSLDSADLSQAIASYIAATIGIKV